MQYILRLRYVLIGVFMLSLLYNGVGSVEGASLFRDRCFPLSNGTPCLNGSTGQIVITNAKINYSDVLNGPAADGNNYPTNLTVTNGTTHTITIGRSGLTALVATFDDQNSGSGGGSIITVESLDNFLIVLNGSRANFSINQTLFNSTYIRNSSIPTCTGSQKLTSAGNGVFTCASDQDTDTNSGYTQWRIAQGVETPYVVTNNTLVKLLPGTGISITNDTTGNITITATSGSSGDNSGWINGTTKVTLNNRTALVGIGTSNPETALHVNGTTYFSGTGGFWTSSNFAKRIEMEGQGGFIIRNNSASGAFGWVAGNDVVAFTSAPCNDNSCTATNILNLNSGGGAEFPVGVVQVNSGQFYVKNAVSNPLLLIGEGTSGGQYGGISWDIPDDILRIGNDGTGTGAISIPETNYVGIGLSNPSRRLTVYDAVDTYFLLQNSGTGTASTDGFEFTIGNTGDVNFWNWENGYKRFATNAKERIRITADGLVGINTTAPTQLLDVNGSINTTEIYVGGGGIKVCRSDGTNCPASSGGSGFTQWRIAGGTSTPYVVTNNTLVKLLAGTGISISNDTTGNYTITNTVTDTNSGYTQWRLFNETHSLSITNNTAINVSEGGAIDITRTGTDPINISIAHQDTSTQASADNSGRTYIQDITLDTYGHITSLTSATETVTDTNNGGISNVTRFSSPNSSIVFSYNATDVNATLNVTYITNVCLAVANQTGVGTINILPRWSSTTNLVASIISADANQANVSGNMSVGIGTNNTVSIGVAGANLIINTTVQVNVSGKVGIDTKTPREKLDVNGNISVTGEINITGIAGDGAGAIVCIKSNGQLGTCSVAIVGVACTCV